MAGKPPETSRTRARDLALGWALLCAPPGAGPAVPVEPDGVAGSNQADYGRAPLCRDGLGHLASGAYGVPAPGVAARHGGVIVRPVAPAMVYLSRCQDTFGGPTLGSGTAKKFSKGVDTCRQSTVSDRRTH